MKTVEGKTTKEDNIIQVSARFADKTVKPREAYPEYSRDVRMKVDDISKRHAYKESVFAEAKTIKDPYSGVTLHKSAKAAANKYGKTAAPRHWAETDHTVSLEKVYKATKGNPFMEISDIKEVANDLENYKLISANLNRSKGGKSNIKTSIDNKTELLQSARMVKEQVKAGSIVYSKAAMKTIKNANAVGMNAAKNGAMIGSAVSASMNIANVVRGDMEIEEAVIATALETAKASAASYASGICAKGIASAANNVSAKAVTVSAGAVEGLKKFANGSGPAKVAVAAVSAGESIIRYMNGEIDETELISELGEKGTGIAMSFAMGPQGAVIGGCVGGVLGSLVPVIGPVLGAKAGAVLGELLFNLAGYSIGTGLYHGVVDIFNSANASDAKKLAKLYEKAANEMESCRLNLERQFMLINKECENAIDAGFYKMILANINGNMDTMYEGMTQIGNQFGISVAFRDNYEFSKFIENKSVLVI